MRERYHPLPSRQPFPPRILGADTVTEKALSSADLGVSTWSTIPDVSETGPSGGLVRPAVYSRRRGLRGPTRELSRHPTSITPPPRTQLLPKRMSRLLASLQREASLASSPRHCYQRGAGALTELTKVKRLKLRRFLPLEARGPLTHRSTVVAEPDANTCVTLAVALGLAPKDLRYAMQSLLPTVLYCARSAAAEPEKPYAGAPGTPAEAGIQC